LSAKVIHYAIESFSTIRVGFKIAYHQYMDYFWYVRYWISRWIKLFDL